MKLENKEFGFDGFAREMAKLKNERHFDYLVTIVGEDFGKEEGWDVSTFSKTPLLTSVAL